LQKKLKRSIECSPRVAERGEAPVEAVRIAGLGGWGKSQAVAIPFRLGI
jgi:hypothetical protein